MKIASHGPAQSPAWRRRALQGLVGFVIAVATAVSASAQSLSTALWAGQPTLAGYVDTTSGPPRFSLPYGVAVDAAGNAYVADVNNNVIRRISSGGVVTTLVGASTAGSTDDSTPNAPSARFSGPRGIAINAAGDTLYVADSGNHLIRRITLSSQGGSVTSVTRIGGTANVNGASNVGLGTFSTPTSVAVDSLGNVYVADSGNHLIRRITGAVVTTVAGLVGNTTFADGDAATATFSTPYAVAVNTAGDTIYVADYGNHVIRRILLSPTVAVSTYAGIPGNSGSLDAGVATDATFRNPSGVAVDSGGNVFVADFSNNAIRFISSTGTHAVSTPAGGSVGSQEGAGATAQFNGPVGIAFVVSGTTQLLYIADTNNHTIRRGVFTGTGGPTITAQPTNTTVTAGQDAIFAVTANGVGTLTYRWFRTPAIGGGAIALTDSASYSGTTTATLRVIAAGGGQHGDTFHVAISDLTGTATSTAGVLSVTVPASFTTFAGVALSPGSNDGFGTTARFNSPSSIAADSLGNLYVADPVNHIIRKITPAGSVSTFAGTAGASGATDATGAAARFNFPSSVSVDSANNVFVADTNNHTIRMITPAGVVTTVAGSALNPGSANGDLATARFSFPRGVAAGPFGYVFVADTGNHTIRRIIAGQVFTVAGFPGASGSTSSNDGTLARFNGPTGIALDPLLNLYVADSGNHLIRRVAINGAVVTVAGLALTPGSTDETGELARFNTPNGVAVGGTLASGLTIYVADTGSSLIRRMTTSGGVVTIGGSPGSHMHADGTGSVARFNQPTGIVVDANGSVFIADTLNHAIRRSSAATAPQVTIPPASQSVAAGQTATYTVVASGSPTPSYQWQRRVVGTADFVNLANDSTFSGANSSTLVIIGVTIGMSGDEYRVVVSNLIGTPITTAAASLTVVQPPVITSSNNATFRATEAGAHVVTATGTPAPTYSMSGNPPWLSLNATTGLMSGTPPNATGSPFVFTVTANNGSTSSTAVSQSFTLTVLSNEVPPTISTHPANATIDRGGSTTLSVSAAGTPTLTYQWRKDGVAIAGATNATLLLSNASASTAGLYGVVVSNAFGSISSVPAIVTVNVGPSITSQPRSQVAVVGGSATFSVTAVSGGNATYVWRRNGTAITGANSSTLLIPSVAASDAGVYDVTITNPFGSVTSSIAQLTLVSGQAAPVITSQPRTTTVLTGSIASLGVAATGVPMPTYQWRRSGAPINGATNQFLVFSNAQAGDAGSYDVVVTNSGGVVTSSPAEIRVIARSYAGVYFGTFGATGSFAMFVRQDNTAVFLGFVSGANGAVLALNVGINEAGQFSLSQSAGNGLGAIQIEGTIGSNNVITGAVAGSQTGFLSGDRSPNSGPTESIAGYYQAGAPTNGSQLNTIVSANGLAFSVVQSGTIFDGGAGTATASGQISIATGRTTLNQTITPASGAITVAAIGVVNAVMSGGNETVLASQRLANISSRARVTAGDGIAAAGFVITGAESKTVLVRAVGPTLATFGVTGFLAAPTLEIVRGSTILATNTGVATSGNRAAIDAAGQYVGAFALGASGGDSAVLITLAPGNYSAIVRSANGTAGIALVEVYDLSTPAPGQKLFNISTRANAGGGDSALIAGVVVTGVVPKRVLIRAIGPGLAQFGVTGVLAQPMLILTRDNNIGVAQNINWNTSPDVAVLPAASSSVGAFPLSNGDSALIVSLAPGNYSAQVLGVGGTTGVALIEVYELP